MNRATSSSTSGAPQICTGCAMAELPVSKTAWASVRGRLRLVGSAEAHSKETLAKPLPPSGSPALPATIHRPPSPS